MTETATTDAVPGSGKVAIVNLNPGLVRVEFVQSLLDTLIGDIKDRQVISHVRPKQAGPLLDMYRNEAVQFYLSNCSAEWMLFIDSDIVFTLDNLYTLLDSADAATRPVVSGTYMMILPEGMRPSLFYWEDNTEAPAGKSMTVWHADTPLPESTLLQVDGCGAGFLLMHRSLLLAMLDVYGREAPWFANEVINGVQCGEDFTFCARVQQMGFPVNVNTAVQVDHIKHAAFKVESFNESLVGVATP